MPESQKARILWGFCGPTGRKGPFYGLLSDSAAAGSRFSPSESGLFTCGAGVQTCEKGSFTAHLLDFDPTGSYLTDPKAVQQSAELRGRSSVG
jgi:hypothetical protein